MVSRNVTTIFDTITTTYHYKTQFLQTDPRDAPRHACRAVHKGGRSL